jgi:catalase
LAVKLGPIEGADRSLDVEASLEILPSVLWDAVVMLDGPTTSLCKGGQAIEFLKDQYRHCKPILLFGGAKALLEKLGLPASPSNGPVLGDPALLAFDEASSETALSAFVSALTQHRNFKRETDPPRV